MRAEQARPAFYALAPGGWRDLVTLLHPPYTAWHLSYVALGAGLAPRLSAGRLGATLVAFFLAVGIAAHCLDELGGRPLGTSVPRRVLVALAAGSLLGAVAIGLAGLAVVGLALLPFVVAGAVLVLAYNLELWGGAIHNDLGFAAAWGAFPVLTAAFAQTGSLEGAALLGAGFAFATSLAQRRLSTWARGVRRRASAVAGAIEWRDGTRSELDRALLVAPAEAALRLLAVAHVLLAAAVLAWHGLS